MEVEKATAYFMSFEGQPPTYKCHLPTPTSLKCHLPIPTSLRSTNMALLHDVCVYGYSHKDYQLKKSATQLVQVPGIHSRLLESKML